MAFKQPRVPEFNEKDGVSRYMKTLVLFLKDFCQEAWVANRQSAKSMPEIDYPVTSVNSKTGDVELSAADVGALGSDPQEDTSTESPEMGSVPINADQLGGMTFQMIVDLIYPIGRTITTLDDTDDPNTLYPWQTWERTAKGRMIIGTGAPEDNDDGTSPGNYNIALGTTGGEEKHTLTVEEMPNHNHATYSYGLDDVKGNGWALEAVNSYDEAQSVWSQYNGGSQPHNNMPPYLAANIWKRVS